jgi:DNA-binding MarR family transcriptional regulator
VKPRTDAWNLKSIKVQVRRIEELTGLPVVVQLDKINAAQRTNLIESGIAFVSGGGQVFIPYWGSYFEEKIVNPQDPVEQLSSSAQLVYLFLYYKKEVECISQIRIAQALGLSKATCSRAIRELKGLELIDCKTKGTAVMISLAEGRDSLTHAMKYMTSPVLKRMYLSELPRDLFYKYSGIRALARQTMLMDLEVDAGYAISKDDAKIIPKEFVTDEDHFRDFGGYVIEVWKYEPGLLPGGECVDDVSLVLELQDDPDERVQGELDVIRKKCGIGGD